MSNMKFRFGLIFLILTVCLGNACVTVKSFEPETEEVPPISTPPGSKEEKIAEFNKSVFCLSVIVPGPNPKRRAIGTGFLVSNKLLATAFHVKTDLDLQLSLMSRVKGQIVAWKKFDDGELVEIPITLAIADQESDTALYTFDEVKFKPQASKRQIKPLPLADHLPGLGEDILSIGYYGLMDTPFNSLGNVSNIENREDIYADMTLMPGNSGSPLISMKTGEVLGINIKVMTMGDGTLRLGIAKRISKLNELLKKVKP
jgi:S1-C subfamily serine protease